MKAFIIHVHGQKKSEEYAQKCYESCQDNNFEVELFEGVTRDTLPFWERRMGVGERDG